MGYLQYHNDKAGSHYLTHPGAYTAQASQVLFLRQGLQAPSGFEEACQDPRRRLGDSVPPIGPEAP